MLYIRFVMCLAIGLMGVSMVLMRLLDTLFADWDVVADIKEAVDKPVRRGRVEAVVAEAEKPALVTRLYKTAQGRETYQPVPSPEELAYAQPAEEALVPAAEPR